MRSFHYRPGKNAFLALGMAVMAAFLAWQWWTDDSTLSLAGAALLAAAATKGVMNALSTEPALRMSAEGLSIRGTFGGSTQVAWRDVQRIVLERITYRYYGFIPMGSVETLCIATNGGITGTKRHRISASTIELPPGGAPGLLMILQAAHLEAVGEAGVAMAGAGKRGWGADVSTETGETSFDADAAIARYLAAKQQDQEGPASRGPAVRPAAPARPSFGRRVA